MLSSLTILTGDLDDELLNLVASVVLSSDFTGFVKIGGRSSSKIVSILSSFFASLVKDSLFMSMIISAVEELSLQSQGLDHEANSHEAGAAKFSDSESDGRTDSWVSESVNVSLGEIQSVGDCFGFGLVQEKSSVA